MAKTPKYLDKFELIAKLDKIEKLVGGAHSWTKGVSARDKDNLAVKPESARAVCFCLTGAMQRICPSARQRDHLYELIFGEVERTARTAYGSLSSWNDAKGRTQTQVVNMVRRTRERLAAG